MSLDPVAGLSSRKEAAGPSEQQPERRLSEYEKMIRNMRQSEEQSKNLKVDFSSPKTTRSSAYFQEKMARKTEEVQVLHPCPIKRSPEMVFIRKQDGTVTGEVLQNSGTH